MEDVSVPALSCVALGQLLCNHSNTDSGIASEALGNTASAPPSVLAMSKYFA